MKNVTGNKWHGFVPALLATMLLAALPTAATAAVCPPNTLTTFANGSPADASQVMDNFYYILGCPNFTGNVGINKAIPSYKLHIVGGNGDQLGLDNTGQQWTQIDFRNNGALNKATIGWDNTSSKLGIFTNGSQRITVDNTGNVGIGNTAPSEKLDVNGHIFTSSGRFRSNMDGSYGAATHVCFTGAGYFDTCVSLRKFKKNIQPLNMGLAELMKLSPVSYDWKDGSGADIGFIAEDVVKVAPVLGDHGTDKKLTGVRYDHMTALLTKAIQEQQHEIASLKAVVAKIDPKAAQTEKEVSPTADTASAPANPLTPTLWALLGMAVGVIVTYAALRKRA